MERSFYLLNTRTICAIFLYSETQCIDGFSLLLQKYFRKDTDAKNPAIFSFFFVTERAQVNAAHAQLQLEKLKLITYHCRNLPISNDPGTRMSRNLATNSLETT